MFTYSIDLQRSKKSLKIVLSSSKNEYFELKTLEAYDKLQKLALSQKLFIGERRLLTDFFSKLTLEYLVEKVQGKFVVHAHLANRSLDEYDLIAQTSPVAVLRGQLLSFCDPHIGWQEIARFLSGPITLTQDEYRKFKKDVDPATLIELDAKEETPEFVLVDATCSFGYLDTRFLSKENELIRAGFTRKEVGKASHYSPTDRSIKAVESLIQTGWRVLDSQGREVVLMKNIEISLQDNKTISGKVSYKDKELTLNTIVEPIQTNQKLALLNDHEALLLSFDGKMATKELLEHVQIGPANTITVPKQALYCLDAFTKGMRLERSPDPTFLGTLRPYQQEGLNWLIKLYEEGLNGLLADEMGLGKTVQVLAFLSCFEGRALICCPTSLVENWRREILSFIPAKMGDITIISYGILRQDIDTLKTRSFDMLIFDEAQAIKNSETVTYKAAASLSAPFRLLMTGTPVENSIDEVVNHFELLEPRLIEKNEPLSLIRKKISPFFLRRKKCDVAKDLPAKIDEPVFVDMTEEQKALYSTYLTSFKNNLLKKIEVDGIEAHNVEVFEAILRLRQIACHPLLVPQIANEVKTSGKFDQALSDIQTLISEGKKILLFSQFTSILHLFAKNVPRYLLLEGQTKNRQELVDTFQNDPSHQLFLISLKAGGVGLNLTKADYVLLYDPWWNRSQEEQAIDRAHRIGREDTVFIKRYYSAGTIEEKILALQKQKGHLHDALFDENTLSATDVADLVFFS